MCERERVRDIQKKSMEDEDDKAYVMLVVSNTRFLHDGGLLLHAHAVAQGKLQQCISAGVLL